MSVSSLHLYEASEAARGLRHRELAQAGAAPEVDAAVLAATRELFARLGADAEPLIGELASTEIRRKQAALDALLAREHVALAVVGDVRAARAAVFQRLCGVRVLDPAGAEVGGGRVWARWGERLGFLARLTGGGLLDFARMAPDDARRLVGGRTGFRHALAERRAALAELDLEGADVAQERADLVRQHDEAAHGVARAREAVAAAQITREMAAGRRDAALRAAGETRALIPAYATERPAWWRLLAWLKRVWFRSRHATRRRELEQHDATSAREAATLAAADEALAAARRDVERLGARQQMLAGALGSGARSSGGERARIVADIEELERDLAHIEEQITRAEAERERRFAEAVETLTDAGRRGHELAELLLELPALPAGLVLCDMPTRGHMLEIRQGWEVLAAEADGWVLAGGDAPREARTLLGPAVTPAQFDALAGPGLAGALQRIRSAGVARLGAAALRVAQQGLREARARSAEARQRRIESIEHSRHALMVATAERMAKIDGAVSGVAGIAIQQARDIVEPELDRLAASWQDALREARTVERLRAACSGIEAAADDALVAARRDATLIYGMTLRGGAHDLFQGLLGGVRQHLPEGLAAEALGEPPRPTPVEPLPSWHGDSRVAPSVHWLGARLRAFASVVDECQRTVATRVTTLRQRAVDDLLSSEPRACQSLRASLEGGVAVLITECERLAHSALLEARSVGDPNRAAAEAALLADLDALAARLRS